MSVVTEYYYASGDAVMRKPNENAATGDITMGYQLCVISLGIMGTDGRSAAEEVAFLLNVGEKYKDYHDINGSSKPVNGDTIG